MSYHCKDKHKQIGQYRVEILPVLDTIRFDVVEKHTLEYVDNDTMFTKPNNLLLVLWMCQYSSQ